jgi:hypothetical protein
MKYIFKLLLVLLSFNAHAVDLREYLPDTTINLNHANGAPQSRYSFFSSNAGLENVYYSFHNLNKPGSTFFWRKEYWQNNAWCTFTYAIMFKGTDQSVTETGDWYANSPCNPNVVLGYKTSGNSNTGLIWSPPNGLTETVSYHESNVWNQGVSGGSYAYTGIQAFSKTGLVEHLPSFTPKYGRKDGVWGEGNGKTYTDVVHMVMYHGTRNANSPNVVRCSYSPLTGSGTYYQSFKNYNAYAVELWLAKGVGIIQERTPFVENGAELGTTNCNGYVFGSAWEWYIDSNN